MSQSILLQRVTVAICTLPLFTLEAQASVSTIESSTPVYSAQVDGTRLEKIVVPPQELELDMNAANSIRSEAGAFKPARYSFPNAAVPRTALGHLQSIYHYDRRRDVPIVSSGGDWVIAEHFAADSHIPTSRFRLLGTKVQRQEQLDSSGRTRKIILVGWSPVRSLEDEDVSDLSSLGRNPAWIRVLSVSSDGRKKLIALAWRREGLEALKSTDEEPNERQLQFGLQNGTVRWPSMTAFTRANDIDLSATRLSGEKKSP